MFVLINDLPAEYLDKILATIKQHLPDCFEIKKINYAIYGYKKNYYIFLSEHEIPPMNPLIIGNWTDYPLYAIIVDECLNFVRAHYVR